MSDSLPERPTYYRPAQVAAILQCSEWWVREQARRRRIPFSWIGGSYLFTEEHVVQIVRMFEHQPVDWSAVVQVGRRPRQQAAAPDSDRPVVQLSARPPRRMRGGHPDSAA